MTPDLMWRFFYPTSPGMRGTTEQLEDGMAHAEFRTSIDSTLSRVMAERLEAEFGIDRGKLSGIAQDGVAFDLTSSGNGMVSVTYIGFITREQYDRITAPVASAEAPRCSQHEPVQHRDARPPWCPNCGLTAGYERPVRPERDLSPEALAAAQKRFEARSGGDGA